MFVIMDFEINDPAGLDHSIRHAESYPFARPACSYLFENGRMSPLSGDACRGRFAVVASGSNASPDRLVAKFGSDHRIPVTRAVLQDFAVAFAGHFTGYGAIPATLCPSPGTASDVWITWLTPEQLTIMHRSEGVIGCREAEQRYDFVKLTGIHLQPHGMAPVSEAGAYLSRRMFAPDGLPIRFAEVAARNGTLSARSHPSTLRLAASLLEPSLPFHAFMNIVLGSVAGRQTLFEQLTPYTLLRSSALAAAAIDAAASPS